MIVRVVGAICLLAAGCGGAGPPEGGVLRVAPGARVVYELGWSWEGATWRPAQAAYVWVTDRGYEVGLTRGYVGTGSLELIPCEKAHSWEHDSTWLVAPRVESILAAERVELGEVTAASPAYCRLHYLSFALDDGRNLVGASVSLEGWYVVPGASARERFTARVGLPVGALRDLEAGPPASPARVILERRPARAFDGVDLAGLTDSELAYEFLKGLARTTRVFTSSE